MTCGQAFAATDSTDRIAQCIKDNKDEGEKAEIVYKYCECMSRKIGTNETQSIDQWEKSHSKEEKECDDESGWK
ncbi:MAG: hypothetical protein HQK92_11150 [Nitrospirae bacterium]|nr:hypothetical protein [Nitrospirota bacterium]